MISVKVLPHFVELSIFTFKKNIAPWIYFPHCVVSLNSRICFVIVCSFCFDYNFYGRFSFAEPKVQGFSCMILQKKKLNITVPKNNNNGNWLNGILLFMVLCLPRCIANPKQMQNFSIVKNKHCKFILSGILSYAFSTTFYRML